MMGKAWRLIDRHLRIEESGGAIHRTRLAVLVMPLLFSLSHSWWGLNLATAMQLRSLGLEWFALIFLVDVIAIMMASTKLSAEVHENEQTRTILTLAGHSPGSVLCWKMVPPCVQVLIGGLIQAPFLVLLWTWGVPASGMLAAMLLLLASAFVALSLGCLCGVILRRDYLAAIPLILLLIAWVATPSILVNTTRLPAGGGPLWTIPLTLQHEVIHAIADKDGAADGLARFVTRERGVLRFSALLAGHVVTGLLALILAAGVLAWGDRRRSVIPFEEFRGRLRRHPRTLRRPSGRAWSRPFVWKEFRFGNGGTTVLCIKSVLYLLLTLIWIRVMRASPNVEWTDAAVTVGLLLVFPLEGASMISRIIGTELHERTLASLLLLPHTIREILREKIAGGAISLLPAAAMFLAVCLGLGMSGKDVLGLGQLAPVDAGLLLVTLLLHYLLYLHIVLAGSLDTGPRQAVLYGAMLHFGVVSLVVGFPMILWTTWNWPWHPSLTYVFAVAGLGAAVVMIALLNRGIPPVVREKASETAAEPG
jgi:hypothetical protein